MQIVSFNTRESFAPVTECSRVDIKRYEQETFVDSEGIAHTSLVEKTNSEFLDVPFRDYSIQSYVATGEINRLHFVSPHSDNSLDLVDRIDGDVSELSAKIDRMEAMAAAASAADVEQSNDNK